MPSTATTRLRLEKQADGENNNTWGSKLNSAVFDLIDTAIAGVQAVTVDTSHTLTSSNYADDEARNAALILSGTGGTLTIPSVEKIYFVINNCSAAVTIDAGGVSFDLGAGLRRIIICDGTDVFELSITDMGGERLQNVGTATADTDAINKGDVDTLLAANATASTSYTDSVVADLQVGALTSGQIAALDTVTTEIENGNFSRGRQYFYASFG